MASKVKKPKPLPIIEHKLEDYWNCFGIMCQIRYLNHGSGWLCPVEDDKDNALLRRHIAYGKVNEYGVVSLL